MCSSNDYENEWWFHPRACQLWLMKNGNKKLKRGKLLRVVLGPGGWRYKEEGAFPGNQQGRLQAGPAMSAPGKFGLYSGTEAPQTQVRWGSTYELLTPAPLAPDARPWLSWVSVALEPRDAAHTTLELLLWLPHLLRLLHPPRDPAQSRGGSAG